MTLANSPKPDPSSSVDETLLEMGLRMTPAERLRWLEDTVEELLPWLGLAAEGQPARPEEGSGERDP